MDEIKLEKSSTDQHLEEGIARSRSKLTLWELILLVVFAGMIIWLIFFIASSWGFVIGGAFLIDVALLAGSVFLISRKSSVARIVGITLLIIGVMFFLYLAYDAIVGSITG